MKPWKRIEPTTITKVGRRTVVTKTFLKPNGRKATAYTLYDEGQHFAAVVALTPENKVIIARQFRFGPEKIMDDLPGGALESDEPAEAAARELEEETGYRPGKLEYLGHDYRDAYGNETLHYFLATDCIKVSEQNLEEDEHVEVALISIDQLIHNATHAKMVDAPAVLLAYEKLQQLKGGAR
jgi:ADP-ribose pyrophosphatase